MHWLAHAPANIALIKYMGKKDEGSNLPDNSSLSYTLNKLITTVKLEKIDSQKDRWELLNTPGAVPFAMSEKGQIRFINHLARIKAYFGYDGNFLIQSCNNFPHSSGLASSASSFAALTQCAAVALSELTSKPLPGIEEQSQLSRQGSGSSCRSFYSPWALWHENEVKSIELPYMNLIHQVVVISHAEKKVSSSEAHQRVKTSLNYSSRSQRAEDNLNALMNAFNVRDWESAFQICWREFQDMHHLFTSCDQPFTYMSANTLTLLEQLQHYWEEKGDGPLVTMDAGPNIHLLYRSDQEEMSCQFNRDYLAGKYEVL